MGRSENVAEHTKSFFPKCIFLKIPQLACLNEQPNVLISGHEIVLVARDTWVSQPGLRRRDVRTCRYDPLMTRALEKSGEPGGPARSAATFCNFRHHSEGGGQIFQERCGKESEEKRLGRSAPLSGPPVCACLGILSDLNSAPRQRDALDNENSVFVGRLQQNI